MNNINYRNELLHHKLHRHATHHVHRLRGKSETHRKVFAFSFAFTVTLFVFMLWYFLSLPKILETYQVTKSENERLDENPLNDLRNAFTTTESNIDTTNIEITQ
jgi:hypothetical protein